MPQQRAVELDAVTNEAVAVVDEQAHVELGPVQVCGRQGRQALLQRGTGDIERIDGVGLAALTGAPAGIGGQVRRDPQHALAALDQKSLQRPRHVPAVFKRPYPLAVEASRPPQQRAESTRADRNGLLAQQFAGRRRDGRDGVRTLVGVRAEHDHDPRPPLDTFRGGRLVDTACSRRCHASIKSRQTSPTGDERQNRRKSGPSPADSLKESQLAARSGPSPPRRTSPTGQMRTASLEAALGWHGVRCHGAVRRDPAGKVRRTASWQHVCLRVRQTMRRAHAEG
jgi:hypothetical protein